MGAENVTIGLAFIAGLLSFISPCVLPLVPAYIGYMSGRMSRDIALQTSTQQAGIATATPGRLTMFLHSIMFMLGFMLIFVLLGILTSAVFSTLGTAIVIAKVIIARVGGVIIIFFGLHFMGVIPWFFKQVKKQKTLINNPLVSLAVLLLTGLLFVWAFVEPVIGLALTGIVALMMVAGGAFTSPGAFWINLIERIELALYSDTRAQIKPGETKGLGGSFMMGIIFAAGWTPCIGPLLGSILGLASSSDNPLAAIPLLTAYSFGLGIPFLLTALLMDSARNVMRRIQRHMHIIEIISGAFLIFIGVLVASGELPKITEGLNNQFTDFSTNVEECGVGFFSGNVHFNQVGSCLGGTLKPIALRQGSNGELSQETPIREYLFHVDDALMVNVELSKLTSDFTVDASLVDANDEELAHSDGVIIHDESKGLIFQGVQLPSAGQYRVIMRYVNDDSATFRVKIRPVQPENTDTIDQPDVVDLNTADDDTSSDESAAADLAQLGSGSLSDFADSDNATYGNQIGDLAYNFTIPTDDRGDIALTDYRGKIVILNFWGTWCGPCRREMPDFQNFYEANNDTVEIVAVAGGGDTLEKIADFRETFGLTFPLGLDEDESITERFRVPGRPATFILDEQGIIRYQSFSLMTDAQLQDAIAEIQNEN